MFELIDKTIYFWLVQVTNLFSFMPISGRRYHANIAVRIFFIIGAIIFGFYSFFCGDPPKTWGVALGAGAFGAFIEWRMYSYLGCDYIKHIHGE